MPSGLATVAAAGLRHSRAPFAASMFESLLAALHILRLNVCVSQPPKTPRPGPPHNPGLRDLVEAKRRWSPPAKLGYAKQGFRGWHERGYLPHRDEPGLTQFVTFRLADSFPESLRSEWQGLWQIEDERERRLQLETYLDKGRGDCHLCRADIGALVDGALRFNH